MIDIFIVDDHKIVIEGIVLMLRDQEDITVVGTVLSGEEAIEVIPTTKASVILLDINMPGINGIDTCKALLKLNPALKIIALSMHKEGSLIKMMLSKGAKGYVLKNAGKEVLIQAIHKVSMGKMFLDTDVNEIVLNSIAQQSERKTTPFPSLSRREKEVLHLILEEYTTQEIANKLHISFSTVETHRRNMLIKLGARNTAGLVRIAIEYGLNKT